MTRSLFYIPLVLIGFPMFAEAATISIPSGSLHDHSDGKRKGTIQFVLNSLKPGDQAVLIEDSPYEIAGRLVIPNGVVLVGKFGEPGFDHQRVVATDPFPEDFEMVRLTSGRNGKPTTVRNLWLDGNERAWRIIETVPGGSGFEIDRAKLERTKSSFTVSDGGNYRSPHLKTVNYELSLVYAPDSSSLTIKDSTLQYAGLDPATGKQNGKAWEGFADGVKANQSENLIVRNCTIQYVLTGGIRITGARRLTLDHNHIQWVARNIEWYTRGSKKGPISDGITGYHNQEWLRKKAPEEGTDLNWVITNNVIQNSGNNGIHVSGTHIQLTQNEVQSSMRNGIWIGDWRTEPEKGIGLETSDSVEVEKNTISKSGHQTDPDLKFLWNTPDDLPPFNPIRHSIDLYISSYGKNFTTADNNSKPIVWNPPKPF